MLLQQMELITCSVGNLFTFFTIFLYILKALGKLFLFPPQLGKLIVREENMDRELYLKMV